MKIWNRNAAQQKVLTFDNLITFRGAGDGETKFQVPVPDSRLRTKISTLFIAPAGTVPITNLSATILLQEAEFDYSGVQGGLILSANVEQDDGTALTIPETGLQGYSREFITAADYIVGTFTASVDGGTAIGGSWVLQCRIQPNNVRFTDEEWQEIAAKFSPAITGGAIIVG